MARSSKTSGVGPTVAAVVSGTVTAVFTVAATQVSLRSRATQEDLFQMLSWIMYVMAAATFLVLLWIVSESIGAKVRELQRLADLDAHLPRMVRIVRRTDTHDVDMEGDVVSRFECEVESGPGVAIQWLTFPVFTGAKSDETAWGKSKVTQVLVNGSPPASQQVFIPRYRRFTYNEADSKFGDVVLEEGGVRVPVFLGAEQRRCTFSVEVHTTGGMSEIKSEDYCFVDVSYVIDELNVHIRGVDGCVISSSPRATFQVQASQLSGDIVDVEESKLQSAACYVRQGVHWRSKSTKVGYRYEIKISGRSDAKAALPAPQ